MHHPKYGRCYSHETNERGGETCRSQREGNLRLSLGKIATVQTVAGQSQPKLYLALSPDGLVPQGGGGPAFRDRGLGKWQVEWLKSATALPMVSPQMLASRLRQYMRASDGSCGYYMPAMAQAVPGFVHASLFLFFVGLGDFVLDNQHGRWDRYPHPHHHLRANLLFLPSLRR